MRVFPPIRFRRQLIAPASITLSLSLLVAFASLYIFLGAGRGLLPAPPVGKALSLIPTQAIGPPPPVQLPAPVIAVPAMTIAELTAPVSSSAPAASIAETPPEPDIDMEDEAGSEDTGQSPGPPGRQEDDDGSHDRDGHNQKKGNGHGSEHNNRSSKGKKNGDRDDD